MFDGLNILVTIYFHVGYSAMWSNMCRSIGLRRVMDISSVEVFI